MSALLRRRQLVSNVAVVDECSGSAALELEYQTYMIYLAVSAPAQ